MEAWQSSRIDDSPRRRRHVVQFYGAQPSRLIDNVADAVWAALREGGGAAAVATAEHRAHILAALLARGYRADAGAAERLVMLDAEETLEELRPHGRLDAGRFEGLVCGLLARLRAAGASTIVVYGEMVGVLWERGDRASAIELEGLWNGVLDRGGDFDLLCGYPVDVFASGFDMHAVDGVLCEHAVVTPSGDPLAMERALAAAIDSELGDGARTMRALMTANFRPAWAAMPPAEATMLWLRNNLPERAEAILSAARRRYESQVGS